MAQCTAPVRGHQSSSAQAACPACRYKSRGYGGGGYSDYGSRSHSSYSSSGTSNGSGSSGSSGSSGRRTAKPKWSRTGSSVFYTPTEVQTLTPFRETVEQQPPVPAPDFKDLFLCHAWNDRQVAAKELYDLLVARKVSVWFSEVDLGLGTLMLREIDKGLAKSRMGIVLVTPAFLERVQKEGSVSDKELSTLLRRNKLIPILHNTTYEALENVSPMLASRTGLSTGDDQTMDDVADKIAELVAP
ncbi:toll/interleukin-1 receptor domain-containing protein [soil metagenome]